MNYYIADTHFGHFNIIRLCNRPFDSVEEMDEYMIEKWNARVADNDDVYIVGDFAFRGKPFKYYLDKLNGKKHLIIGNHDIKALKDCKIGEEFVEIKQYETITDNGISVFLCHYPVVEWPGFYHGAVHIYGHVHNSANARPSLAAKLGRAYNAGADVIGFEPKTLKEIIDLTDNELRDGEELL